jgi:cytochrome b pre-mRNA-processing protein 3
MLRFLFRGLTAEPRRGQALFERVVEEARVPHWYEEGQVPDTIDGRFAMLATVCALIIVRLEQAGEDGELESAALTERFIEAMDSEHREMGLNDPGLGRRVRKLVGALERRVDQWRSATAGERDWRESTQASLYAAGDVADAGVDHSEAGLRKLWDSISEVPDQKLLKGEF